VILPMLVLVPAVMGLILQHARKGGDPAGASGGGGGSGSAKPAKAAAAH
jgi:hypothetical protein